MSQSRVRHRVESLDLVALLALAALLVIGLAFALVVGSFAFALLSTILSRLALVETLATFGLTLLAFSFLRAIPGIVLRRPTLPAALNIESTDVHWCHSCWHHMVQEAEDLLPQVVV